MIVQAKNITLVGPYSRPYIWMGCHIPLPDPILVGPTGQPHPPSRVLAPARAPPLSSLARARHHTVVGSIL